MTSKRGGLVRACAVNPLPPESGNVAGGRAAPSQSPQTVSFQDVFLLEGSDLRVEPGDLFLRFG